jgi:serine/threonine protein kinase
MHHVHQCGVVHRDLKPANVLLTVPHPRGFPSPQRGKGEQDRVPSHVAGEGPGVTDCLCQLPDFGLAKLRDRTSLIQRQQWLGSPEYIASETSSEAWERSQSIAPQKALC